MRVLHVLDHSLPIQSGYTFRTLKLLQQQHLMGIETYQLTGIKQGHSDTTMDLIQDMRFYRSPLPNKVMLKLPVIKQWLAVRSLRQRFEAVVQEVKPDLIHVHSPVLNGLAVLKVARRLQLPVVYEIRAFWEDAAVDHGTHKAFGLRYRLSRWLESYIIKRAQHVTTICEGLKSDLLNRGLTQEHITVVPNAVDKELLTGRKSIDHTRIESLEHEFDLKNKFVLGFIGSFYAYEGLDILLEAVKSLKNRLPQLRVLLIGGGPEEARLGKLIHDLQLQNHVMMVGRVPHEEVAQYYQLFDFCVFPRKKMRLTELVTPLKPLEAMAHGVPVLASKVGGHYELIDDKVTGFLFEADSVVACAQAIYDVVQNSKPMEVIYKAKNYILEERNWQTSTENYRKVYEKALSA